jgi:hypothetical protein
MMAIDLATDALLRSLDHLSRHGCEDCSAMSYAPLPAGASKLCNGYAKFLANGDADISESGQRFLLFSRKRGLGS